MRYAKTIRDPVHGWVRLLDSEVKVVDSPLLQRLRYVKQLGFAYLVYPSATHTRFEHTLGVLYIANMFMERIRYLALTGDKPHIEALRGIFEDRNTSDELAYSLRLAALLHDVGHPPWSHAIEHDLLDMVVGTAAREGTCDVAEDAPYITITEVGRFKPHELTGYLLLRNKWVEELVGEAYGSARALDLARMILYFKQLDRLREQGDAVPPVFERDVARLSEMRQGDRDMYNAIRLLSNVISGTLDADRIDYVMRDMYFTGAAVGSAITNVDVDRIVSNVYIDEYYRLIVDERARVNIEGYVLARYNLYRWVYLHHKTVLFTKIGRMVLRKALSNNSEGMRDFTCLLARFVLGRVVGDELLKVTDDGLNMALIFSGMREFLDYIVMRKAPYISLWKRDRDYQDALGKSTVDVNAEVDELAANWDAEDIAERLRDMVLEVLRYLIRDREDRCGEKLAQFLSVKENIIVEYVKFSPHEDIGLYHRGRYTSIVELSPLVSAIREAWEKSPHLFIYVHKSLDEECREMLKKYIGKILGLVINLLKDEYKDMVLQQRGA